MKLTIEVNSLDELIELGEKFAVLKKALLDDLDYALVDEAEKNGPIAAIKLHRERNNSTLKESKEYVDTLLARVCKVVR